MQGPCTPAFSAVRFVGRPFVETVYLQQRNMRIMSTASLKIKSGGKGLKTVQG